MNPKFVAFLESLCYVLVAALFVVCCFGLSWCLDFIGPDPGCTELQLAYFGVGLFSPLVLFFGSYVMRELVDLLCLVVRRLLFWLKFGSHSRSGDDAASSDERSDAR